MHSFLYCSWFVMMSYTLLFFLLPNSTLGHLGSALKTGSGEGRPPILSHVRVSREPQPHHRILLKNDEASDPLLQTSNIKSPSYQHKILQFHSNGQTSSGGYDFMPLKLITNQYPSTKSFPIYPVASKFGKVDTRRLLGSTSTGSSTSEDDDDEDDSWERYSSSRWEPNLLPKSEDPTYTPYIGVRALTNIPQFFQHLRDNIHSIYEKQRESAPNNEENGGTGGAASLPSTADGRREEDIDKFSETQDIKIASPTRRGYSSNSETSIAQDGEAVMSADLTNRDSRGSSLYTLGNQISSGKINDAEQPDGKTKELLYFLGHRRQEYPKANNYNPAWLFTNLGLGKRSSITIGGSGDSFHNQ